MKINLVWVGQFWTLKGMSPTLYLFFLVLVSITIFMLTKTINKWMYSLYKYDNTQKTIIFHISMYFCTYSFVYPGGTILLFICCLSCGVHKLFRRETPSISAINEVYSRDQGPEEVDSIPSLDYRVAVSNHMFRDER